MPIITQPTTLPEWGTNPEVTYEPSPSKKASGFDPGEYPASQTMNWILWDNFKWAEYAKSYFDTITNTNVTFDDTGKILKVAPGQIRSENADTDTTITNDSDSRIVIRNTDGTANNFSDLSFVNQNNFATAKVSAKYVNHTDKETELSFFATPASGSMTEYMNISSGLTEVFNTFSAPGIGIGTSSISELLGIRNGTPGDDANIQLASDNGGGVWFQDIATGNIRAGSGYDEVNNAWKIISGSNISKDWTQTGVAINQNGFLGVNTFPNYQLDVLTSSINSARIKNDQTIGACITRVQNNIDTQIAHVVYGSTYAAGTEFNVGNNGAAITCDTTFAIGTSNSNVLGFGTNGLTRVVITSAGITNFSNAINISSLYAVRANSGTVANGASIDIDLNDYVAIGGILNIENENQSNAQIRSTAAYSISVRVGTGFATTLISNHAGPTGAQTFTITNPSGNIIRVTNTGGSTAELRVVFSGLAIS